MIRYKRKSLLKRWCSEKDAVAAVEAALIFPILLTLLLGVFDMGNAILANQKAIRASQIVADLITRESLISDAGINEAVEAGRLAFEPLVSDSYGIDIVSVRFDEDEVAQEVWRETSGMSAVSNVLTDVASLAEPNGGVVVVNVSYDFNPVFAGFVVDKISMQETAFARGRKSAVVNKE